MQVKGYSRGMCCGILFFAVERNSPELVTLLCKAGADPNDRAVPYDLPVLAYSVLKAEYDVSDTTDTLIALLAAGASSTDIPKDMWKDYAETPKLPDTEEAVHRWDRRTKDKWCTPEVRRALCRSLTLFQCYCLWKSTLLPAIAEAGRQMAEDFDIEDLFKIHYHMVGQLPAALEVIDNITSHFAINSDKPLVLLFTGPSGHGKTELACRMGALLSLDIHTVDCAEMDHETDIFGPKPPYEGHKAGSSLNNFLAEYSGSRSVVFLDEIDKTTDEVRNALLLPIDSGRYKNRVDNKRLDCRKTIWIMAANYGEDLIKDFWDTHLNNALEDRQSSTPFGILQKQLRRAFTQRFGAPLTGRITSIVPFLPFTRTEQAVLVSSIIRKLRIEVRKPIDIDAKQFIRRLHLHLVDEWQIAKFLANEGYEPAFGARSLRNVVDRQIERKLVKVIGQGEQRIHNEPDEGSPLRRINVSVDGEDKEDGGDIEVVERGVTRLQMRDAVETG